MHTYSLILLLLCKVSIVFSVALSRRTPECLDTCYDHNLYFLPFLSTLSTESELLKLKYFLLNQVNACEQASSQYSLSVYLAGHSQWMKCCSSNSCALRIFALKMDAFVITPPSMQLYDNIDVNHVFDNTMEIVEESSSLNNSHVYLIMDYIVSDFIDFSPQKAGTSVHLILLDKHGVLWKGIGASMYPGISTDIVHGYSSLAKDEFVANQCSTPLKTQYTCPLNPDRPVPNYSTPVDLRIFMAFGNISESHFAEVIENLDLLLSEPQLEGNSGKILISGPRNRVLASCSWRSVFKCIRHLNTKSPNDVHIKSSAVSVEDIDFAPDVLNFMRGEALKSTQTKPMIAVILSDFVSQELVENSFFFRKAMDRQHMGLAVAVLLKWNGLDKKTVHSYYGNLTSIENLYPLEVFGDLSGITGKIVNASRPHDDITTTSSPTTSSDNPSTEPPPVTDSSPVPSFPTTTSPDDDDKGTTTTPKPLPDIPLSHVNDVIIALSFADWTSESQLNDVRQYLSRYTTKCVSLERKIAIVTSDNQIVFCVTPSCLQSQINRISLDNSAQSDDDTVQELSLSLSVLNASRHPADRQPSLFLFTDFVSSQFVRSYENAKNSTFRNRLSYVDFEVILINQTESLHRSTSLNNQHIHQIINFEQLSSTDDLICPSNEKKEGFLTSGHIILICFGSALLISLSVIIGCKLKAYTHDKWHRYHAKQIAAFGDRSPIVESEYSMGLSDEKGFPVLNVSSLSMSDDPWEMNRQQIVMGHEIGRGSSGVVYRGSILGRAPCEFIHRRSFFAFQYDNCPVAIKVQLQTTDEKGRKQLLDEIEIMKALRPHLNIANMLGCVTSFQPVCLLLEYAGGGSLKQFMRDKTIEMPTVEQCNEHPFGVVCQRDILSFIWQICDGMSFIHDCGVVHRDLAARNVLLETGRNVLISDFGLAMWAADSRRHTATSKRLPVKWTAPEALAKGIFTEYSDVWSFAVCAWEILNCSAEPFAHVRTPEILSYINSGKRLDRPETCQERLWSLLLSCWKDEPTSRPRFSELKREIAEILEELSVCYGYLDLQED